MGQHKSKALPLCLGVSLRFGERLGGPDQPPTTVNGSPVNPEAQAGLPHLQEVEHTWKPLRWSPSKPWEGFWLQGLFCWDLN